MTKKHPSYLNLSQKEFERRIKKAYQMLEGCCVCPRKCGVNRLKDEKGFCGVGKSPVISSFNPHFGEEAPLVGTGGSGTIFFTHCNLACVYCQNWDISQLGMGNEVSLEKLAQMMIKLQDQECHNINFVSPTPYVPQILKSLPLAIKKGLKVPLVYNTNSYDSIDSLKLLEGIIDIYMPDAKYAGEKQAEMYSLAPNYFEIMKRAIREMSRQVGELIIKSKIKNQKSKTQTKIQKYQNLEDVPEGVAVRGLLVRHLVLPDGLAGTEKIMEFIAKEISPNTFINIMAQYHPCYKAEQFPPLDGALTLTEHKKALEIAKESGLKRIYY